MVCLWLHFACSHVPSHNLLRHFLGATLRDKGNCDSATCSAWLHTFTCCLLLSTSTSSTQTIIGLLFLSIPLRLPRMLEKYRKVNFLHILLAEAWGETVKTVTGFPFFRYCFVLFLVSLDIPLFWTFLNQVRRRTTSLRPFSVNTWETTPYPNPLWVLAPRLWQSMSHLSQADVTPSNWRGMLNV